MQYKINGQIKCLSSGDQEQSCKYHTSLLCAEQVKKELVPCPGSQDTGHPPGVILARPFLIAHPKHRAAFHTRQGELAIL